MDFPPADVHHPALWRIATAAQQLHQPTADELCALCATAYPCEPRQAADRAVLASLRGEASGADGAAGEDYELIALRLLLKAGLTGRGTIASDAVGSAA